jgi:DNA-binding LacI/PurR family transcriptional regulator/signal transduction histidine kinase
MGEALLHSRPNIGLFIPSTTFAWSARQWEGLAQSAQALDVNLIAYIGGQLRSSRFMEQANALYDLAGKERLDGLILMSGGLTGFVPRKEMTAFCDRFRSLPLVSVEIDFPGIPSLLMDDYRGMKAVVAHMIETHGYRRIAFLRGSVTHEGVEERHRAYVEVLAEHGLPFDPDLVSPPSAAWDGAEVMRVLLDERGARFDALISSCDTMLLEALPVLRSHGIRVPEDIGVAGFDDIPEGEFSLPPLTTARFPFIEIGRRAVELAAAHAAGRSVPEREVIPISLVVRQSCGCASPAMRDATEDHPVAVPTSANGRGPRESPIQGDGRSGPIPDRLLELRSAFMDEISEGEQGRFLSLLSAELTKAVADEEDVSAWAPVLSSLRRQGRSSLADRSIAVRTRAEELWFNSHALITETALLQRARRHFQFQAQRSALQSIAQALITTFDIDPLMDIVADQLPRLGIPSCYLSLYVHPETPAKEARLILAYDEGGRKRVSAEGIIFPASQLAPAEFWNGDLRTTRLVLPLYFRTEPIGFVAFGLRSPEDAALCETLQWQLSSALKGALLMQQEKEHARTQVEKEKMQALGTLVAGVAHEINTPVGIGVTAASHLAVRFSALESGYASGTLSRAVMEDFLRDGTETSKLLLSNLNRAASLIASFKKVAVDATNEERRVFRVKEYFEDILTVLSPRLKRTRIAVDVDCPQELEIDSYPGTFSQILTNLVVNSIEHGYEVDEIGVATIRVRREGANLKIVYEDDGRGIQESLMPRVFEPFFTTRKNSGGSGLGLHIVYNAVVGVLGGRIRVSARPGGGARFTITMPLKKGGIFRGNNK